MISKFLKQVAKPALGVVLLALIFHQLDRERIFSLLQQIDWLWFAFGLAMLVASNLFSAYRWSKISAMFGTAIGFRLAIKLYAQGITANTVLPGGIIGGDVWRTLGLIGAGATKKTATLSVLYDRISGVWVLGICSLLAGLAVLLLNRLPQSIADILLVGYGLGLLALAILPLLLRLVSSRKNVVILVKTLVPSLAVQLCALLAFWSCFRALGQTVDGLMFVTVCSAIFVSAVIPAAIGGFGARELGAVAFLAPIGIAAEISFLGSVLYGLMATLQGVFSVYWWIRRQ